MNTTIYHSRRFEWNGDLRLGVQGWYLSIHVVSKMLVTLMALMQKIDGSPALPLDSAV